LYTISTNKKEEYPHGTLDFLHTGSNQLAMMRVALCDYAKSNFFFLYILCILCINFLFVLSVLFLLNRHRLLLNGSDNAIERCKQHKT